MNDVNVEVANRNAIAAIEATKKLRDEYAARLLQLEMTVNSQRQKIAELEQKYNLLLSQRFNRGPTAE